MARGKYECNSFLLYSLHEKFRNTAQSTLNGLYELHPNHERLSVSARQRKHHSEKT